MNTGRIEQDANTRRSDIVWKWRKNPEDENDFCPDSGGTVSGTLRAVRLILKHLPPNAGDFRRANLNRI